MVCATLILQYDNEWTEVSCTHFAIKRLLDGGIPDQDEIAKFEVVIDDGGGMLLFKADHSFDLCGVYIGCKHYQMQWLT